MSAKFIHQVFLVVLFLTIHSFLYSQKQTQDFKFYIEKAEMLRVEAKPKQALELLDTASKIFENNEEYLVRIYSEKSKILAYTNNLISAKKYSDLSVELSNRTNKKELKAFALYSVAYLNHTLQNQEQVIYYGKKCLNLLEHIPQESELKAKISYLIYMVYANWTNTKKMKEYAIATTKYAKISKDFNILSNGFNAISSTYQLEFEKTKNKKFLDSSWYYLKKSEENYLQFKEKVAPSTQAVTYINIANYYLNYSGNDYHANLKKAEKYLNEAENISKTNPEFGDKLAFVYGIRSEFAFRQGNINAAESYLNQSIESVKKLDVASYKTEYNIYNSFVKLYQHSGDYKKALEFQKKAEQTLQKIMDEKQIFNSQKIEIQYETEKKNKELLLLKEKEKSRKLLIYLLSGILISLGIMSGLTYRSYHCKLKYSQEKEKKLALAKEKAELNAEMKLKLEKEEKARLIAEQKLLEIQQNQLRKEMMANTLQIERKNETLQKIQSKISDGNSQEIKNLIREEHILDADFEEAKLKIQKLHPDFFNILKKKALQRLTPLDMKYCAYIHLQLSTKQIAQILHIEPKSVRMSKYRLKQKFGLGKETDIYDFMTEVFRK